MATGKSSRPPSQSRKKRPSQRRKKTKKILLDKTKVRLLAGVIFLTCCVCIAVNVLAQSAGKKLSPGADSIKTANSLPQTEKSAKKNAKTAAQTTKTLPQTAKPAPKKEEPVQKIAAPRTASPASKTEKSDLHRANSLTKTEKPSSQTENPVSKPAESSRQAEKTPAKTVNSPSKTEKLPSKTEVLPAKTVTSPSKLADSSSGLQKNPFSIPPAKNGATLVFVIDDAGLNVEFTKRYAGLPFPLTIAVLPKLAHSKECAYVVRSYGKELILHQPMQSLNHSLNPGPGKITVDMSFEQIHSIIRENLAEIGPGVKGLNNHEGSEVTEDVLRIGAVLDACLENSIYFLDSRTTANTKAPQAALERDMKIFEKSGPYIDNVVTREAMLEEIYRALDAANKNGSSIVIAHVDKSAGILPNLLEQIYPHLVKAGYRFATPSTLR